MTLASLGRWKKDKSRSRTGWSSSPVPINTHFLLLWRAREIVTSQVFCTLIGTCDYIGRRGRGINQSDVKHSWAQVLTWVWVLCVVAPHTPASMEVCASCGPSTGSWRCSHSGSLGTVWRRDASIHHICYTNPHQTLAWTRNKGINTYTHYWT